MKIFCSLIFYPNYFGSATYVSLNVHLIRSLISSTFTPAVFVSLNCIQPPFFDIPLLSSTFISIILLTAYDFSLFITFSNHLNLFCLILSTISTTPVFLFHIHFLFYLLSSLSSDQNYITGKYHTP